MLMKLRQLLPFLLFLKKIALLQPRLMLFLQFLKRKEKKRKEKTANSQEGEKKRPKRKQADNIKKKRPSERVDSKHKQKQSENPKISSSSNAQCLPLEQLNSSETDPLTLLTTSVNQLAEQVALIQKQCGPKQQPLNLESMITLPLPPATAHSTAQQSEGSQIARYMLASQFMGMMSGFFSSREQIPYFR